MIQCLIQESWDQLWPRMKRIVAAILLKFVVLFGDVSGVVVWASWFQVQGAWLHLRINAIRGREHALIVIVADCHAENVQQCMVRWRQTDKWKSWLFPVWKRGFPHKKMPPYDLEIERLFGMHQCCCIHLGPLVGPLITMDWSTPSRRNIFYNLKENFLWWVDDRFCVHKKRLTLQLYDPIGPFIWHHTTSDRQWETISLF